MLLLALLADDPVRGPSFAELAGGAAVVAVVALLAWGASSIAAMSRKFDAFSQTLFGPPEAPGGVVRDVERIKAWRHDVTGHLAGIAAHVGVELEDDGKVRQYPHDVESTLERRFTRRRAEDRPPAA